MNPEPPNTVATLRAAIAAVSWNFAGGLIGGAPISLKRDDPSWGSAFGTGPGRWVGLHGSLPALGRPRTARVRREDPPRSTRSAWGRFITERPARRRSASP